MDKRKATATVRFDVRQQQQVLKRMASLRKSLVKNGVRISREQIKAAIEDGRL